MNPVERRSYLDLAAARYLDALERDDFAAMEDIWRTAEADLELEQILREVHAGLLEVQVHEDAAAVEAVITTAIESHLPSAEIVRVVAGPITAAAVAEEMYRHTPDRLPIDAHLLNELLRQSGEPLPADLGLSELVAWGETHFGAAPAEYWKVFRQAAVKLELRQAAEAEYCLAARRTPQPEGKP